MPACEIDSEASPTFRRLLKHLEKKYRHIVADVDAAFDNIRIDYETREHATAIPLYRRTLWKHRCRCSDLQSGKSGGARIVSWLVIQGSVHRLYPILIYMKSEQEDAAPRQIEAALDEIESVLAEKTTP